MGAQLRVYRQKIRSAKATKKITRAMELISASRIQKAQQRMAEAGPYSRAVTRAVSAVATYSDIDHPLLTEAENPKRAAVVVFAADRGLAGAFSAQVLREAGELAERLTGEGKEVIYYVLGRKAVQYFQFRERPMEKHWLGGSDQPQFETAKEVAETVIEKFTEDSDQGGVDELHIVFNRFVSLVTQQPDVVRVLPLEVVEGVEESEDTEVYPLYEFEPEPADVLDALLPRYIETRIFQAMLQSAAAEHAARHNARQAEITQQISEIVGGANALQDSK
jgi:F-type H+-transporting ATPase subunit gamma